MAGDARKPDGPGPTRLPEAPRPQAALDAGTPAVEVTAAHPASSPPWAVLAESAVLVTELCTDIGGVPAETALERGDSHETLAYVPDEIGRRQGAMASGRVVIEARMT